MEGLAALCGVALGQRSADNRDPVGPLQLAENLEGLDQQWDGGLGILPGEVDLG
jgi:hypothetical protein